MVADSVSTKNLFFFRREVVNVQSYLFVHTKDDPHKLKKRHRAGTGNLKYVVPLCQ